MNETQMIQLFQELFQRLNFNFKGISIEAQDISDVFFQRFIRDNFIDPYNQNQIIIENEYGQIVIPYSENALPEYGTFIPKSGERNILPWFRLVWQEQEGRLIPSIELNGETITELSFDSILNHICMQSEGTYFVPLRARCMLNNEPVDCMKYVEIPEKTLQEYIKETVNVDNSQLLLGNLEMIRDERETAGIWKLNFSQDKVHEVDNLIPNIFLCYSHDDNKLIFIDYLEGNVFLADCEKRPTDRQISNLLNFCDYVRTYTNDYEYVFRAFEAWGLDVSSIIPGGSEKYIEFRTLDGKGINVLALNENNQLHMIKLDRELDFTEEQKERIYSSLKILNDFRKYNVKIEKLSRIEINKLLDAYGRFAECRDYTRMYNNPNIWSFTEAVRQQREQSQMFPKELIPEFLKSTSEKFITRQGHSEQVANMAYRIALEAKKMYGDNAKIDAGLARKIGKYHDLGHGALGHRKEVVFAEISEELGVELPRYLRRHEPNIINLAHKFGWTRVLQEIPGKECTIADECALHRGEGLATRSVPGREEDNVSLGEEFAHVKAMHGKQPEPKTLEGCLIKILDSACHLTGDIRDLADAGYVNLSELEVPSKVEIIQDVLRNSNFGQKEGEPLYIGISEELLEKFENIRRVKEQIFKLPEIQKMRQLEDRILKTLSYEIIRGVNNPDYLEEAKRQNMGWAHKLASLLKRVKYDKSVKYYPLEVANDLLSMSTDREAIEFYAQIKQKSKNQLNNKVKTGWKRYICTDERQNNEKKKEIEMCR